MRISKDRSLRWLYLSQKRYIEKILKTFNMDKAKVCGESVSLNSKKRTLTGSIVDNTAFSRHFKLLCFGIEKHVLVGYTDADIAGDIDSHLEFRNGNELVVIQNVFELSRRFELDPIEFNEKIQALRNLEFRVGAVIRVLEEFPKVIMLNEPELLRRVEFLDGIGISMNDIDRVCNLFPGILWSGIGRDVIRDEVVRELRLLGMELGEFSRCLELLRTLKCRAAIKDEIFSYGAFKAVFEAKLRIDCLCRHGLIHREALKVLWLEPRTILHDLEGIERKIKFLVNKMKMNIACLVETPEYLGVNFEKDIVPRRNVI
ncbi:Transcription termination factor, mitochondrial/chloroplastic [Dillenia turbinata]|uniref:Transcription termination factor, mitochondrial/chloroplastic n=1 Tax=Dillenia turbinata TaxID=194707 RepID=A0AAN8Z521_9MAGN